MIIINEFKINEEPEVYETNPMLFSPPFWGREVGKSNNYKYTHRNTKCTYAFKIPKQKIIKYP